jgi:hypothetical protein
VPTALAGGRRHISTPIYKQSSLPPITPAPMPIPERSISLVGVIITIAVVVLLAVGMFLLIRPR